MSSTSPDPPPPSDTRPSPADGTQAPVAVRGYEVLRELGRGGMGVVYLARHLGLNRLVALKMILAGAHAGREQAARFLREARAVARLHHPHIVQAYDQGEQDGLPYLVLEYVDGGSLADRLAGKPLPPAEAAGLVEALAEAVQHAHEQGLLHRDLKPANVLLASRGREPPVEAIPGEAIPGEAIPGEAIPGEAIPGEARTGGSRPPLAGPVPKIADFGLARCRDGERLTYSGAIVGTPAYMAPEQARGDDREIGPATDVYALGAILYECLTGRPPFQGRNPLDVLDRVRSEAPVPPRRLQGGVPEELESICLRCLHKSPAQRYPTAAALAGDLRAWRGGRQGTAPRRRRRRLLAVGAALMLALGVLAAGWRAWQPGTAPETGGATAQDHRAPATGTASNEPRPAPGPAGKVELRRRNVWKEKGQGPWGPLAFPTDGKTLVVGRGAGEVYLRDVSNGGLRGGFRPKSALALHSLALAPDDGALAVACSSGGQGVVLWELPAGGSKALASSPRSADTVLFAPKGARLATGGSNPDLRRSAVYLWDTATGRCLSSVEQPSRVRALAFSPDGTLLAACCGDPAVEVLDAATGMSLPAFRPSGGAHCLAFSPDGRLLAAGQRRDLGPGIVAGAATVWDVKSRQEAVKLGDDWVHPVSGVAFSPDGKILATLEGEKIRFWDAGSGALAATLAVKFPAPGAVRFLPGGATVAVWGYRSLRLYDARTGHAHEGTALEGFDHLTLSPAGDRVAGIATGGEVHVWDVVGEGP